MTDTTRDLLARAAAAHPKWTAADHARALGVSRERIRQLAAALSLDLPRGTRRAPLLDRTPVGVRRPEVALVAPAAGAHSTARGTIGELVVAADLLARRFQVYAPITRHNARCDLIALSPDGRRTVRVEVRTGSRGPNGELRYNRHGDEAHHDVMAIVVAGEPILYRPEIGTVSGERHDRAGSGASRAR